MSVELRNAIATKRNIAIEMLVTPTGEIFALRNDEDADLLPNVETIKDCLECGFKVRVKKSI